MKKTITILVSLSSLAITASISAYTGSMRFIYKNSTNQSLNMNCGNLTYPINDARVAPGTSVESPKIDSTWLTNATGMGWTCNINYFGTPVFSLALSKDGLYKLSGSDYNTDLEINVELSGDIQDRQYNKLKLNISVKNPSDPTQFFRHKGPQKLTADSKEAYLDLR